MSRVLKKIKSIITIMNIKIKYGKKLILGNRIGILKGFNVVIGKRAKLIIEDDVFFNNYCSINCLNFISIGEGCIFGEGVKIYDHNHRYEDKKIRIKDQGFKLGTVEIGKNCWIGSNVTILNNVKIGDNVIIGANCLVYKSIPNNTIVKKKQELIYD